MERGQHDAACAPVVLAVCGEEAVAEQRDQVAHPAVPPAEVRRSRDGDVVVRLGTEREHHRRVHQPHREDRPVALVEAQQQRERLALELAGPAHAEAELAWREPAAGGLLPAHVGAHALDHPGGHGWGRGHAHQFRDPTLAAAGVGSLPAMRTGRFRREEKHVARYAWPAGVAAGGAAWYAADSLRHRREGGHGYRLRGEVDVREASFLRAAEALTGAPVSHGNDAEHPDQRRRDLPRLPGRHPRRRGDREPHHLRLLARRDRHRGGRHALREGERGRGVQRDPRRRRRGADGPQARPQDARRRRARVLLPAAEAVRGAPPPVPQPPQAADSGRHHRIHRRGRHRGGVDRERPGSRPLARHPRASDRAGGARPPGRVRRELARVHRRRARRRPLPALHRGHRGRRRRCR